MSEKEYPLEEVAEHNSVDDLWVAVDGKIYDITSFAKRHPGGVYVLRAIAGTDCTEPVRGYHKPAVLKSVLPKFQIGVQKDYKPTQIRKDMQQMEEDMAKEGLYKTPWMRYYGYFALCFALFALSQSLLVYGSGFWIHMLAAVFLGLFWQQLSFCGHDFGHNAVAETKLGDFIGSIIVCAGYGVSGQWWKSTHNTHHIVTNSVEFDPDVQYLPLFAVSKDLLGSFFSVYHQKAFDFGKVERYILSFQHLLYFPVMAVARFNLYFQSTWFLVAAPATECPDRLSALAATSVFYAWNIWMLMQFSDWTSSFCFLVLSNAVAGIIHVQITLSHFAQDTYHGQGLNPKDPDFFVKNQLNTSLNVECSEAMDWFHGGLQYQVEHHLFPRIARHHLRYVRDKYVRPFAEKHNIFYHQMPFFQCNAKVIRVLRETANEAWSLSDEEVKRRSKLGALANAEG